MSYRRTNEPIIKKLKAQPAGATGAGDHGRELPAFYKEWIRRIDEMAKELNAIPGVSAEVKVQVDE